MSSGTVYRRKDGYWVAAVTLNGERVVKYGKTRRDAQARLLDLAALKRTGALTPPTKVTLAEWLDQWLAMLEPSRRPKTLHGYRDLAQLMTTYAGATRLNRLTPRDLTAAFGLMREHGIGTGRIRNAYRMLRTALRAAVRLEVLDRSPLDRVEEPSHTPREKVLWSQIDIERFILVAEASGHHYAPLFLFLIATGLRTSEALGLHWQDLQVGSGTPTVRVERSTVWVGRDAVTVEPKTKAGRRTVSLPRLAMTALARLPRPADPNAPIFRSPRGSIPNEANLLRALRVLCERAAVPRVSIHTLRAVHAAVLAANGVDPHSIRRRLGHARIATTFDIYAYAVRPDTEVATAFDRVMPEPHHGTNAAAAE